MSYLLKNGILLVHGNDKRTVTPTRKDLLISGNRISRIFDPASPPNASELKNAKVIDCTNKIVSPGFVDTHHHLWQTQLKGRHANEGLLSYMVSGNFQSSQYGPEDVYVGELGGLMESIDGGTTTVVDHAHVNYSRAHSENALQATIASGIRSVFCYTPTGRIIKWDSESFENDHDWFPPWVMETYNDLASHSPYADGRVHVGFAFDGWFFPKEQIIELMKAVRAHKPKVITSHYVKTPWLTGNSLVQLLDGYGLMGPDILLSHANAPDEATRKTDASIIKKYGAHTSSTPDTELQMGHGDCVCFEEHHSPYASLGSDCHSNNSSDMLSAMRLALQSARGKYNDSTLKDWKVPSRPVPDVVDVFNLATVKGAEAVNLADEVGTLEEGKKADIVVFDGLSPGMVCAAEEDPVAAIVLHASVRDIELVFVDGVIRKEGGKLRPVDGIPAGVIEGKEGKVEWEDVARELLKGRKKINEKITTLNFKKAREAFKGAMKIDENAVAIPIGTNVRR